MSTYKNILVAVDLGQDSLAICQKAIEIAQLHQASLKLVHVVEFIFHMTSAYDPLFYPSIEELEVDEASLLESAQKKMDELINSLPNNDSVAINYDILSGVPKKKILAYAEKERSDLIICGSHGLSGFQLLLGSTANAILHHAPCDVLAIRTPKQTE